METKHNRNIVLVYIPTHSDQQKQRTQQIGRTSNTNGRQVRHFFFLKYMWLERDLGVYILISDTNRFKVHNYYKLTETITIIIVDGLCFQDGHQ
jgi:hypothetical protein